MNGYKRFEFYLDEIEKIIQSVRKQEDFGLKLLQLNLRTPFFMIEGLSRIYSNNLDNVWLDKLKNRAKEIEDALGVADHYIMTVKTFESIPEIPSETKNNIQNKIPLALKGLETLLIEKGWMDGSRIKKTRKKLNAIDWSKEKKEIKDLHQFYLKEIDEIIQFYNENAPFKQMEDHVHEFRRKLRWLSIYATSLRGAVALTKTSTDEQFKKYLNDDIVKSPYNQLPENPSLRYTLLLDKNRFYALSWLIKEIGEVKDYGLMNEIIALENVSNAERQHTDETLNKGLLEKASTICQQFMQEKHLEKLVLGIGKN